jgi:hypothetical protein
MEENYKRAGMHAGYAYLRAEKAYEYRLCSLKATAVNKPKFLKYAYEELALAYEQVYLMEWLLVVL